MNSKKCFRNDKAAISIEAAIVIPTLLIFIGIIYLYIFSIRVDLIYQEAGYSSVRELELLLSLSEQKDIKNDYANDYKEKLKKFFENKISAKALNLRQHYWLGKNINPKLGNYFIRDEYYQLSRDELKGLEYEFSYTSPKILGTKTYKSKLPIPYWGGLKINSLELDEQKDEKNEKSIWSEHNFKRGNYFRKKYGANLPHSYPVIAKVNGDTITSIMSLDLTAPSYRNFENLNKQVSYQANKLKSFAGTENWGREKISINVKNIKNRVLLIIIPENSDASSKIYLKSIKVKLDQAGFTIKIVEDGVSEKFE